MPKSTEAAEAKPRELAKQETREALIAAGISAFAEEGLDAPSLDSICARAGYTRGAFYVHFKDRDDFLAAVMEHMLTAFVDAIVTKDEAPAELSRTVELFVNVAESAEFPLRGPIPMHQFLAACARSERVRQQYVAVLREAVRKLSVVAAEGQKVSTVRADIAPERFALLLMVIALGVQSLLEVGYDFEIRDAAADLLRLLSPLRAGRA